MKVRSRHTDEREDKGNTLYKIFVILAVGGIVLFENRGAFAQISTGGNYDIEHRVTVNGGNLTAN